MSTPHTTVRNVRGLCLTSLASSILNAMRFVKRTGKFPADSAITTVPSDHPLILQVAGYDPDIYLAEMRREFGIDFNTSLWNEADFTKIEERFPGLVDIVLARFEQEAANMRKLRTVIADVVGRLSAALMVSFFIAKLLSFANGSPEILSPNTWMYALPGTLWFVARLLTGSLSAETRARRRMPLPLGVRNVAGIDPTQLAHALLRAMEFTEEHGRLPEADEVETDIRGHRLVQQFCGDSPEVYVTEMHRRYELFYCVNSNGDVDLSSIEDAFPGLAKVVIDRLEVDAEERGNTFQQGRVVAEQASTVLQVGGGFMVLLEQAEIALVGSALPELTMLIAAPGALFWAARKLRQLRTGSSNHTIAA